ncbi:hypothetical protein PQQ96_19000 [Paraburkholderia sediminicola]|uniref:hypothetical protein n=1 Tax=Paraburkholderia sediminicola TaxID=458836 RepID=UPI0038BBB78E
MTFKTKVQSAVEARVHAFIDKARGKNPFTDAVWDEIVWAVDNKARASDGRKTERIWFNAAFVKKSTLKNAKEFPRPFADLVKAYACHIENRQDDGVSTIYHNVQVRAFRYLHAAFRDSRENPWELRPTNFDMAIRMCQEREERSSAYRIGVALAAIAQTMDSERLCEVRLNWLNPISRDAVDGGAKQWRVGKEFEDRRNAKLPTSDVVAIVGAISSRTDLSSPDLVRQRSLDLCVCGGFRPSELLTLAANCWIEEIQVDESGQPMLGPLGKPAVRYGIRYIPAKGAHVKTQIKWLATVMVDVARRAVVDIKERSEPFRNTAAFMASSVGRTLLPERWHSLPGDELMSLLDVYDAVGLRAAEPLKSARGFVREAKLTIVDLVRDGKEVPAIAKWELERYLVERSGLETVFPEEQGHHKLKDSLFVFPINYFHSTRSSLNGTATLMTYGQLTDYMVGRTGVQSIFERSDHRDDNGDPLKVTAYKFRHWLDTMAEDAGMSQLEIARWFGRGDIGHNSAYNHVTGLQLAASIHKKRALGKVQGPVTEAALNIKDPIRQQEFIVSSSVTAHRTDIGICEHNWAALPCPKHRECTVCDEHLLEKGNPDHIERTRVIKDDADLWIALAEEEVATGTSGADNWLAHQKLVRNRASAALAVHADVSIADGTLVQLPSYAGTQDDEDE